MIEKSVIFWWGAFFAIIGGITGFIGGLSEGIGLAFFMMIICAVFFFILGVAALFLTGVIYLIFFPSIIVIFIGMIIYALFFAEPVEASESSINQLDPIIQKVKAAPYRVNG